MFELIHRFFAAVWQYFWPADHRETTIRAVRYIKMRNARKRRRVMWEPNEVIHLD